MTNYRCSLPRLYAEVCMQLLEMLTTVLHNMCIKYIYFIITFALEKLLFQKKKVQYFFRSSFYYADN